MTLDHQPLVAFRWDKQGRECERRQGNGLVNRYDYDNLSRLTHHQIFHGFDFDSQRSPTLLWQQDYGYQADNQLSQIRGNAAREYQYDAIGQLTSEGKPEHHQTHHAQPLAMLHYDATGNLLSDTKTHIAKGNRLTFFSDKHFEYDRFGKLIAEKRGKNHRLVIHYQYDCRHRLIKVIKPTGLSSPILMMPLTVVLAKPWMVKLPSLCIRLIHETHPCRANAKALFKFVPDKFVAR
jgi:hypothetical protein